MWTGVLPPAGGSLPGRFPCAPTADEAYREPPEVALCSEANASKFNPETDIEHRRMLAPPMPLLPFRDVLGHPQDHVLESLVISAS